MLSTELLEALRARVASNRGSAEDPASEKALADAERALGFRLPDSLRRLLATVGNGGFGPAYGLYGAGTPCSTGRLGREESIESCFSKFSADPRWPRRLLPICDWGGAVWSCIDRSTKADLIVTSAEGAFATNGRSLESWLRAWLDGVDLFAEMFGPAPQRVGINPFTKRQMTFVGVGPALGRPWPFSD
jgi:hypothetical protein